MKKIAYGLLSGLLVLATTVSAQATTPTTTIAQSNSATIEQMFREEKVLTDEIQALMAQMKTMMAEMKALTSLPAGQTPTTTDLYRQQQLLIGKVEALTDRTKLQTILSPGKSAATIQDIQQQQVAIIADLKTMMADLKTMMETYRGRAGTYKR